MTATIHRIPRTSATPEESARKILSLFTRWNKGPGAMLARRRLLLIFPGSHFQNDRILGLAYAVAHGWLHDNGKYIQLTRIGFGEISRSEYRTPDSVKSRRSSAISAREPCSPLV